MAIVESLRHGATTGDSVVLATVVRVVGSSYGGVGTRMAISVDGSTVGLVSGGCLESDLCAHAVEVHTSGIARVVTYDTRADDDAVWGLGLGCNGLIDVLLQPLTPSDALAAADMLAVALAGDAPSVIVTVTESDLAAGGPRVGAQALLDASMDNRVGDWGDASVLTAAHAIVPDALDAGRCGLVHEIGAVRLAYEIVNPAIRLVICGSGPDVAPLCRIARDLGWDVVVVDHRPITESRSARFAGARVVECAEPRALDAAVDFTRTTAAVVMSHHFARDTDYVNALLAADVAYVGVLGPRARMDRILTELAARGEARPNGGALFGPVGLDLGGEGPAAIALAIAAEVAAFMHGRDAAHLCDLRAAPHAART